MPVSTSLHKSSSSFSSKTKVQNVGGPGTGNPKICVIGLIGYKKFVYFTEFLILVVVPVIAKKYRKTIARSENYSPYQPIPTAYSVL